METNEDGILAFIQNSGSTHGSAGSPQRDRLDPVEKSENFERDPCVYSILKSLHGDTDFYSVEWIFLYVLGNESA